MHSLTLPLIYLFLSPLILFAQEEELPENPPPTPALLDFDGDGISDLVVHEDQLDGSPNELMY